MMNATIPADLRLRQRAIAWLSLVFLAGAFFLFWFQGFLREVEALGLDAPRLAFQQLHPIQQVLFVLVLCSATVGAGLLGHLALRIWRAGQWPPPGLRVMWETPIRTGRHATLVAVCCLLLALVVLAYGPLMMMLLLLEPALLDQQEVLRTEEERIAHHSSEMCALASPWPGDPQRHESFLLARRTEEWSPCLVRGGSKRSGGASVDWETRAGERRARTSGAPRERYGGRGEVRHECRRENVGDVTEAGGQAGDPRRADALLPGDRSLRRGTAA